MRNGLARWTITDALHVSGLAALQESLGAVVLVRQVAERRARVAREAVCSCMLFRNIHSGPCVAEREWVG